MTDCAPTDRILQSLRVRVPGATDPMLSLELFNTIDEFLRRTSAWKYESSIDLAAGVTDYSLGTPADSVLVRLDGASYNGQPVLPAASSVVQSSTGVLLPDLTFPDGDVLFDPFASDLNAGTGDFTYALYRPSYISVNNPPNGTVKYPFVLNMVLSISQDCLACDCGDWQLPDWMYDMYFEDWLNGTLARLYSMPSKPWMNLQLGQFHGKKFRSQMAYRKQEARRGFQANTPTWRFPRSGW